MEIVIGIQNVSREVTFSSTQTASQIADAVRKAVENASTLQLEDEKGRLFLVPAPAIGYVTIGAEETRRVGFSA